MKNSNKILFGLGMLLLAAPLCYALIVKNNLAPVAGEETKITPQGTVAVEQPVAVGAFRYLSSEGVAVHLDTGQWQVTVRTYEDLLSHCYVEVRHDTLFVSKHPDLEEDMDNRWIRVYVKAPVLEGLAVSEGGWIWSDNPGAVFHPERLALTVGKGAITVPVYTEVLDVQFQAESHVTVYGKARRLNLDGQDAKPDFWADNLAVDTAFVKKLGDGVAHLLVNGYLEADLRNRRGNVLYQGHPTVVKRENALGRVMEVNGGRSEMVIQELMGGVE